MLQQHAVAVAVDAVRDDRLVRRRDVFQQRGPAGLEVRLALADGLHEAFELLLPRARDDAPAPFDAEDDRQRDDAFRVQVRILDRAFPVVAPQPLRGAHDGLHFLALLQLAQVALVTRPRLGRVGRADVDEQFLQPARRIHGILVVLADERVFRQRRQFADQAEALLEHVLRALVEQHVERVQVALLVVGLHEVLQPQRHAADRQQLRALDAFGRAVVGELLGHHRRDAGQLVREAGRLVGVGVRREQPDRADQPGRFFDDDGRQHRCARPRHEKMSVPMLRRLLRRGVLRTDGTCLRRRYSSSRVPRCWNSVSSSGSSGSSTSARSAVLR